MLDQEKVSIVNQLEQLEDIATHKACVMQACHKMARYFIKKGDTKLALEIMDKAFIHDRSKLQEDEFYGMAAYSNDNAGLKDVNINFPCEGKMEAIRLHWSRNSHHPEYWGDKLLEMPELDMIEMCCDWYSRSIQFGDNLVEWIKKKQEIRFNFPETFFKQIMFYCHVLNEDEANWDNWDI